MKFFGDINKWSPADIYFGSNVAIKKLTDVDLEQVYLQGNKIGDAIDDNMIDAQLKYYATLPKPNKLEFAKRGFFAKTYDNILIKERAEESSRKQKAEERRAKSKASMSR